MKKAHELKTDPETFDETEAGRKTFEIRLNDRDFQVGDELVLRRTKYTGEEMAWNKPLEYSGGFQRKEITHIMRGPIYGLAKDWVIMSHKHVAP